MDAVAVWQWRGGEYPPQPTPRWTHRNGSTIITIYVDPNLLCVNNDADSDANGGHDEDNNIQDNADDVTYWTVTDQLSYLYTLMQQSHHSRRSPQQLPAQM